MCDGIQYYRSTLEPNSVSKEEYLIAKDEFGLINIKNKYTSYYAKLKELSLPKTPYKADYKISEKDGVICLSYCNGNEKLFIDAKTQMPIRMENRHSNGDLSKEMDFSFENGIYKIYRVVYAMNVYENDEEARRPVTWAWKTTATLKEIQDENFDKNPYPKALLEAQK